MKRHALQVVSDGSAQFRWLLLQPTEIALAFESHSHSECAFDSYESALNAGAVALSAVDEQPYENEAADPVGDGDCSSVADVPPT